MIRKFFAVGVCLSLLSGCASHSLTGAWQSSVQFTSGDFASVKDLELMYVFNRGGTMTESSNYDSAPPVPPAYGIWRSLGGGRFEAKYLYYTTKPPEKAEQLSQGWGPAGHGELVERIEMARDAKSFESKLTLQLFDASGKPIPGGGEAVGRGKRIGF